MFTFAKTRRVLCLLLGSALASFAQQNPAGQPNVIQATPTPAAPVQASPGTPNNSVNQAPVARDLPADSIRPNYILGPNDQFVVRAPQIEEIHEKPFRIDADGNISLPLGIGKVRAGGLTIQELEAEMVRRLREFVIQPQVMITMTQFRSEPIFLVGAFRNPGIYGLQGRRTLVEMLIAYGSLQPNASRHIKLTRRAEYGPIPLPNAVEDPDRKSSSVEISLGSLRDNVNPAEDIVLEPYDVISVDRAEMLYVNGEVGRIGGIEFGERDSVSISQALTLSGGFSRDADRSRVRVLRPIVNTSRRAEIEIDMKRVLEGKDNDFPLLPNDLLYVKRSYKRAVWVTLGQVALPIIPYLIFVGVR